MQKRTYIVGGVRASDTQLVDVIGGAPEAKHNIWCLQGAVARLRILRAWGWREKKQREVRKQKNLSSVTYTAQETNSKGVVALTPVASHEDR